MLDSITAQLIILSGFRHEQLQEKVKHIRYLALILVLFLTACETTPPVQEMSDARQAIAVAKEAGAQDSAAVHLKAAEDYLESAEKQLGQRDYTQARYDARQAKMKALDALREAEAAREKKN